VKKNSPYPIDQQLIAPFPASMKSQIKRFKKSLQNDKNGTIVAAALQFVLNSDPRTR
jgi:hypothetical protein